MDTFWLAFLHFIIFLQIVLYGRFKMYDLITNINFRTSVHTELFQNLRFQFCLLNFGTSSCFMLKRNFSIISVLTSGQICIPLHECKPMFIRTVCCSYVQCRPMCTQTHICVLESGCIFLA